jgi:Ran GTPase-activating protein (RanGAP) involved in mRNA processing and transport
MKNTIKIDELFINSVVKFSELNLANQGIGNAGLKEVIKQLNNYNKMFNNSSVPYIHTINLSKNNIDWEGAVELSNLLKKFKDLKKFEFSHNDISSVGGQLIVEALRGNKKLTRVNLEGCKIGDDGILELIKILRNNENIYYLNLKDNNLTSRAAIEIAKLLDSKQNLTINLKDNLDIDSSGAKALIEKASGNNTIIGYFFLFEIIEKKIREDKEIEKLEKIEREAKKSQIIELDINYNEFVKNFGIKDALDNLKNIEANELSNLSHGSIPLPMQVKHAIGNREALHILKQALPEQLVRFLDSDRLVPQKEIWCVEPKDAFAMLKSCPTRGLIKLYGLENCSLLLETIIEKIQQDPSLSKLFTSKLIEIKNIQLKLQKKEEASKLEQSLDFKISEEDPESLSTETMGDSIDMTDNI